MTTSPTLNISLRRTGRKCSHCLGMAMVLLFCFFSSAQAALLEIPEAIRANVPVPEVEAESWLLVDYETGWVLGSKNADIRLEPASLTKLMTSYLVFEALKNGEIAEDDLVYVSKKAWKTSGSKMFIQVDTQVKVIDLVQGLIIQSGNDAAVALAEHLGGSEQGFASRMNIKAGELGMANTNFTNSHGLPESNHYSTARDMTLLATELIRNFPDLYRFYSQLEYTYNDITQQNRNILLTRDPTVDGIKTGYTKNAGYCLIGTALRDGVRFVATVTGASSKTVRANQVQSLLQFGYGTYEGLQVFQPGAEVKSLPLWMAEEKEASIGVDQPLGIIFPKGEKGKLSAALDLPESLEAPIDAGTRVGSIEVKFDGEPVFKRPLVVNQQYEEGTWTTLILDSLKQLIF